MEEQETHGLGFVEIAAELSLAAKAQRPQRKAQSIIHGFLLL